VLDVLSTVILYTDYDTTLKILTILPKFNTNDFWKCKCSKLYPNKTYFDCFNEIDNFLIKERTFIFIRPYIYKTDKDVLIEYNQEIHQTLKKILLCGSDFIFTKINIDKPYLLIEQNVDRTEFLILGQFNSINELNIYYITNDNINKNNRRFYGVHLNNCKLVKDINDIIIKI